MTTTRRARSVHCVRCARHEPSPSENAYGRRSIAAALLAGIAFVGSHPPAAQAFLGFGDDGSARYADDTASIIAEINSALALEVDNPAREDTLRKLREDTIAWVSRYRRNSSFSGRPSFSNLYSAINALDGQLNSFGFTSKIPAKRLDRIQKEVADADRQLQRGR